KPFVVNTNDVKIRVLGTAFNVKGYASDRTVETTVVRGLVRVESVKDHSSAIFVNPNEKAVYLKKGSQLEIQGNTVAKIIEKNTEKPVQQPILVVKTNPEPVTCWKDQLLVFSDETFEDMVVKMERWYNIKINLKDSTLRMERFNGKFVHNETVYQVLEAIKLTTPISYKLVNNEINITRKHNYKY
ncbi:MAG TPA: FecR domain-containing protein, partial [Bacteroidales bacterium]